MLLKFEIDELENPSSVTFVVDEHRGRTVYIQPFGLLDLLLERVRCFRKIQALLELRQGQPGVRGDVEQVLPARSFMLRPKSIILKGVEPLLLCRADRPSGDFAGPLVHDPVHVVIAGDVQWVVYEKNLELAGVVPDQFRHDLRGTGAVGAQEVGKLDDGDQCIRCAGDPEKRTGDRLLFFRFKCGDELPDFLILLFD